MATERSTRARRPPKPYDVGSPHETTMARVAGLSIDAMLRGGVQSADRCPAGGAKRKGGTS